MYSKGKGKNIKKRFGDLTKPELIEQVNAMEDVNCSPMYGTAFNKIHPKTNKKTDT